MKFYGIIEADSSVPFMIGMPILGMAIMDNGHWCMGQITGDMEDLASLGHVTPQSDKMGFTDWVSDLNESMNDGKPCPPYKMTVCTWEEACARTLELYKDKDSIIVDTVGGPSIEVSLTLIKNKLESALTTA